MKYNLSIHIYAFIIVFLTSCATNKLQVVKNDNTTKETIESELSHSFFLIGDAGNSTMDEDSPALKYLEKQIKDAPENSTLIFLGDNVYETGIPSETSKNYALAKRRIEAQTDVAKKFNGKSIFIPGNHDWYNGLKGLKREEKLVEKALGKHSFLPEDGCPLKRVKVSEDIVLIIIDTHWYVTNWDKHPNINNDCEIKTRTKFFDEVESLLKKSRGKTTIVAMHHPMFTNGSHGGKYSFKSHITPLPILGSLKNLIRKTSGISNADLQNKKYNEFKKRIVTLSQENDRTIFVSGHDHNLQYLVQDNIPQIVSGSGSKTTATKLSEGAKFTYGTQGFAILDVYKNGASKVKFYSVNDQKLVYESKVFDEVETNFTTNFTKTTNKSTKASIYSDNEVEKGKVYKYFWGERYRQYFGTEVAAPIVYLDTLFGGLEPVRKGGGHQSKSLRLKDKKGREYVMRALRKNAVQYLQAVAFKDQYIEGQFKNTATEALLMDAFTGSHPYAPFTIGELSDAIGVYHTNPILYYVPKQNTLGNFNDEFGDELYMIEERTSSGHGDKSSFGFSNELISTDDLIENLNKSEDYVLDEEAYIKARLFDMLIGDWDRHEDQWRWAAFNEDNKTIYRPVPRDRDQAFSIFSDGLLISVATSLIPGLRLMKSYEEELKSPKWFNLEPYPLDMILISESNKNVWNRQVKLIQHNITDSIIDKAFSRFPKEVQDETILEIKRKLVGRKNNLQKISDNYYEHINKFQVVRGTQKDDWFDIERLDNGETKITVYTIKNGKKNKVKYQRTFDKSETKEIWIYAQNDEDYFNVYGEGKNLIQLRLVGGKNNDIYDIKNRKKLKVYDYKSKKNTFKNRNVRKKLTDDYETNIYDYKKLKNSSNMLVPIIGYNPDDGFKTGIANTYTSNGFERNPFTAQHTISAAYYFATNGYEINYSSEFANILKSSNLGVQAMFTSPNYAINYFGTGNNSFNPEADKFEDKDYNRVKIRKLIAGSFLNWRGDLGSELKISLNYEDIRVENTENRFIGTQTDINPDVFNSQKFINSEIDYNFENYDDKAFPTLGMSTDIKFGFTSNLENSRNFSYLIPSISFIHKLNSSGQLVFATKLKSHFTFGDSYNFFQAASIGANEGLRGYRNQRFTGKNAFYHSSDIRLNIQEFKTALLPIHVGIFGGFDYGTVWGQDNTTFKGSKFNNSYGGGVFFNFVDMVSANLSLFNSDDDLRFSFNLGFNF